ncbi:type II toxin-antitoxin system MqsR family toxin [Devosia honganensis]|uniref:Type II toxin-antitoxin system MqsR family toxin n=1 Tax=Devosia honganensis TaxID=1610527 RepID=A0ABV7X1K6_9HYPH
MTTRAAQDARGLGFDSQAIAAIIRSIERPMFYKSMTTYMDSSRWQDVYHVPAGDLMLYISSFRRTSSPNSSLFRSSRDRNGHRQHTSSRNDGIARNRRNAFP